MCTVLLRFAPGTAHPLWFGAVRDEFVDRTWDPPAAWWGDRLYGGRDRTAGGTWLAVDPAHPGAVAAVLNGARLPPPPDGIRPSRGTLALGALRGEPVPEPHRYDGFHLVLATPSAVRVWTWDGTALTGRELEPGDHVLVNAGEVPPDPLRDVRDSRADWVRLLGSDAVLVDRTFDGRRYASTSTALVTLDPHGPGYAFNPHPGDPSAWYDVEISTGGKVGP